MIRIKKANNLQTAKLSARKSLWWLPVVWSAGVLHAQACLVLVPAGIAKGAASLELSLDAPPGYAPAAVEWTFQYPSSNTTSLSVDDGPVLSAAGKTAICAGDRTAYKCLTLGANTKTISNGIMAKVTAVLAPGASGPAISIHNPVAVAPNGHPIPIVSIVAASSADVSTECELHQSSKPPLPKKSKE